MLLDNWMKISASSRNSTLIAVVVIVMIAVYNWMVAPHTNHLHAAQTSEAAADKLVNRNNTVLNEITDEKKELKQLQNELEQIRTAVLFDADEAKEFFNSIQARAEKKSCVINLLKLLPVRVVFEGVPKRDKQRLGCPVEQPQAGYSITENCAVLSITGSYRNIALLINNLQSSGKKVFVNSIDIISSRTNPAGLDCNITIKIFIVGEQNGQSDG